MNHTIRGAMFALATLAGASALADPHGYVTVGIGTARTDIDCIGYLFADCNEHSVSGHVIGGWEFVPGFAAEASYDDLGQYEQSFGVLNTPIGTAYGSLRSRFLGLGAAWRPNFGHGFGGIARTGVAFEKTKWSQTPEGLQSGPVKTSGSYDTTHPYFGLGATYAISKQVGVELDWQHVVVTSGFDVSTFSVSGTYHF